jgi:hypothetical protein
MATQLFEADQIIELSAADVIARPRMAVKSLICRGTAGGTFVIQFGSATLSFTNSTNMLTLPAIEMNRSTNRIELVSGPTNARLYILLEQKP